MPPSETTGEPSDVAAFSVPKTSSTYAEDIVTVPQEDGSVRCAVVLRCWADEHPDAVAEAARHNIPYVPLKPGELEVMYPDSKRATVSEATCSIVDRGFMAGDLVRAARGPGVSTSSRKKPQAGIITSLSTKVKLESVLEGRQYVTSEDGDGWIDAAEVVSVVRISRGDHVVYNDWVGMVEEVLECATVETTSGVLRRICDTSGSVLVVGATPETLMIERMNPNLTADIKRVIDVRQVSVAVNWLCISQLLDPATLTPAHHKRPKRYWSELDELTLVRSAADHLHSVGDKVVLRNARPSNDPLTRGQRVYTVTRTSSTATVLFQDATTKTYPTPSLNHCLDIDEDLDVFPGDVGVWSPPSTSSVSTTKIGVVQSMNARGRTVKLRWLGTDEEEVVSGLEFDPHGPPPEVYGVRRQDWVVIAREEVGNGCPAPTVPRLGESEVMIGGWPTLEELRTQISVVGMEAASLLCDCAARLPKTGSDARDIRWYGEVVALTVDGQVRVRFPSGEEESFPLTRIYHLDDGMEGGMMGGEPGDMVMDDEPGATDDGWETDGTGTEDEAMGWAEDAEEEEGDAPEADEDAMQVGLNTIVNVRDDIAEVVEIQLDDEPPVDDALPTGRSVEKGRMPDEVEDCEDWQRFLMLEEAPADHHYIQEPIQVPSKAFMSRVKKEYNVLSSSLPPNILVRAYEDRGDLLRCLIIGPEGTPFQSAPFLFDLFLSPTKFPNEPPLVYFHSWAGGTRVSPNLYAEGKVCLSLLGTWNGDKTESWSAARSSILQILISIQSLIMVEKPYYTEPGFEKHAASIEGETASDLYNERTFVLTRAFVKRAVEYPPTNFATEIKAYYLTGVSPATSGALTAIVSQSRLLLEEGEAARVARDEQPDAEEGDVERGRESSSVVKELRVLTEGAALSLKRTMVGLEPLLPGGIST